MAELDGSAKDRRLIRDAGLGILMFAALALFIVIFMAYYVWKRLPWTIWIPPSALTAVGVAILARSVIAAWIAMAGMAIVGVGGAIGVLRSGGSPMLILVWPLLAAGVCGMLWRAIAAMKRVKAGPAT
ncbi:MAG: hypothetical protein ACKV2T_32105 [Kofleriaceae bacterium]